MSAPTAPARPRWFHEWRRVLAMVAVAPIVALTAIVPVGAVVAAPVSNAITGVSIRESTIGLADILTLDLTWAVPDSAVAGDFFELQLPAELIVSPELTFPLRDPDGNIVANAAVSGQVVTFTLTDFVNDHVDVVGTAFFESRLNSTIVAPETTIDVTFVTDGASFGDTLDVVASRDRTVPNKFLNIPPTNGPNGERLLTGLSTGVIPASAAVR